MKKTIFTISFIIIAMFLSASLVFAEGNNFENVKNNIVDTVNNAGNVVGDTASGAAGAVQNGMNTVGNATQNMSNDVNNAGENMANGVKNMGDDMGNAIGNMDYTAERTSTENNANNAANAGFNNTWTWIIVGIIALVVIGLIWYFVTQNNH